MNGRQKQKGMVLAVVLILTLPLTLMAVSVMQWGREQMKISAANRHYLDVLTRSDAEIQAFWQHPDLRQILVDSMTEGSKENIKIQDKYQIKRSYEMPCARTRMASSNNLIQHCRYMEIAFNKSEWSYKQDEATVNVELPLFYMR